MFFGNNRALEEKIRLLELENQELKNKLENEQKIYDDINDILVKISKGLCGFKVKSKSTNPNITKIIENINASVDYYTTYGDEAVEVLVEYGNANFEFPVKVEGLSGKLGSVIMGIRALGSSVSELLALIDVTSEELNIQMVDLSSAANSLSKSATLQAASLEETAAALEEVTSTIINTSENTLHMAQLSKEVELSASKGQTLANQTFESMENINNEVSTIDDAITVIDQISFQTNILSLNAAVEAATAGEAGKGFAVVAGEVRNLATRSAEAAKEIKNIVQSAKDKASVGKQIATNMIQGYTQLNENISNQIKIIEDVSLATKEQRQAIEQINHAVTHLDQATQQNASAASQIDAQAISISVLAQELVNTVNTTRYRSEAKEQICDMKTVFTLNALKLDHIKFKDSNFKKLGERTSWSVTNSHSCRLGQWMDEQLKANKPFTKTQNWQKLVQIHDSVHSKVQDIVNKNGVGEDISMDVEQIDHAISQTFWTIQQLKKEHCEFAHKNNRRKQKVDLEYTGDERRSLEKEIKKNYKN